MKQFHILAPHETLTFNAGQAGRFLLLREASYSILVRGDELRPTEIERGDTIDVTPFTELTLENHHEEPVSFEYQISDVPILTQSQKFDVSATTSVYEIKRPISVLQVHRPVRAEIQNRQLSVDVRNPQLNVHVDNPKLTVHVDNPKFETQILNDQLSVLSEPKRYTYAKIGSGELVLDGTVQTIVGHQARHLLFIQAPDDNEAAILVQGFLEVKPGGHLSLETLGDVTVQGKAEDRLRVGESR